MHILFTAVVAMQQELLLFAACFFIIAGMDDLLTDLIWIVRAVYRKLRYYRVRSPMRACQIPLPERPGHIAIFVAAWREAAVIGQMLLRCGDAWQDGSVDYQIYIGCYPNDAAGIAAVIRAAATHPHVRLVLVGHDGPTNKADCLNHLWAAMQADELAAGRKYKAVLMHDAEDRVHADELAIVDRLIEKHAAVQFPVIPVTVPGSTWISGHYCDEFAEAHGKVLVVREAIGAALPLAGVGCALDRNLLGRIALQNGGAPFDGQSLTEDYELGIRIGRMSHRTILPRILDADGMPVGTRACFPDTLSAAVRQKARWMTGIALAGWDRLGWQGGPAEYWMRLRDRRAVLGAVVLSAAYLALFLTCLLMLVQAAGFYQPEPMRPWLRTLIATSFGIFLWRSLIRAYFVSRLYGWREALVSVPRNFIANIVLMMAARRACADYFRHCVGKPLVWHSTVHHHVPGP